MSTRGLFGFRKNNSVKAWYNHFDSYPEGLGQDFVDFLKTISQQELSDYYDKIIEIDANSIPTDEIKKYCKEHGWYDDSVSNRNDNDWYCLLRGLQDLSEIKRTIRHQDIVYLENAVTFIQDSCFCEYAYVYDVDNDILECYKGFQHEPQDDNPFGTEQYEGYYPCKLIAKISVADHTAKEIIDAMHEAYKIKEDE